MQEAIVMDGTDGKRYAGNAGITIDSSLLCAAETLHCNLAKSDRLSAFSLIDNLGVEKQIWLFRNCWNTSPRPALLFAFEVSHERNR